MRQTFITYRKIVFILSIVCFAGVANAQNADEVIAKYILYTGGEKNWKAIRSIVASGIYNYGGIEFPFTSYSKAPNLYKFVVPFQGKYFAQAFDGKQGWKIDAFKNETTKTILSGKPAVAMANEADVELESPLINYHEKGHTVLLEGIDTVDGKACYKVKLTRKNGDIETWFFGTADFDLVKKQAVSKNAELENSLLDTYFSNYQLVGTVKIPFKAVSKSNGQTVLTITLSKVDLNLPVADSEFKP